MTQIIDTTIEEPLAQQEQLARLVRMQFGGWYYMNSSILRRVLDVSPHIARQLWSGHRSYTVGQLAAISAFFGVSPVVWFDADAEKGGVINKTLIGPNNRTDVHARAWDRLMTARESGYCA